MDIPGHSSYSNELFNVIDNENLVLFLVNTENEKWI